MPASPSVPQVTYLVLAKAPVPGAVKTRLTPAYSPHEAAALAAAALLDTLDVVRRTAQSADGHARRPVVALTGDLDRAAAPDAVRAALTGFTVLAQRGHGLGPRLANAHVDAAGPEGTTVQIGMDTPQVCGEALTHAAARVLDHAGPDAVLGPAEDGGWWLLALRRAADAGLIAAVPMSTPDTGRLTRHALERGGLRVELADPLCDVDEPGDVAIVAESAPDSRFAELVAAFGRRVPAPDRAASR